MLTSSAAVAGALRSNQMSRESTSEGPDAHKTWASDLWKSHGVEEEFNDNIDEEQEFSDPDDAFDECPTEWFSDKNAPLQKHRGASKLSPASRQYLNIGRDGKPVGMSCHPEDYELLNSRTCLPMRSLIWVLLQEPDSSEWAYKLSMFFLLTIFVSTAVLTLDTLPSLADSAAAQTFFQVTEALCIVIFTVEYVLKLLCAPGLRMYVFDKMNVVDLVSFLPWYINLAICMSKQCSGDSSSLKITQVLRVLRLVRIFRVLKLGHHFQKLQVLTTALKESSDVMMMLLFILGIIVSLFSALVYQCEKDVKYVVDSETGDRIYLSAEDASGTADASTEYASRQQYTAFSSIPATFWFMVVTLMTVGYGDMHPVTPLGQTVTALAMILAMMVLALPISVIGTNFTQAWIDQKERNRTGKATRSTPPSIQIMSQLLTQHMSNVDDLVKKLRAGCKVLQADFHELGFKIRRKHHDCLTLMRKVHEKGVNDEALGISTHEQELLSEVEGHEDRMEALVNSIVDLLRVADVMQSIRVGRWPSKKHPHLLKFSVVIQEYQARVKQISEKEAKCAMIQAKLEDLELALHEAMVMVCELESHDAEPHHD